MNRANPPVTAGYSGTPLVRKLGLKDGMHALLIGIPEQVPDIASFAGFAGIETAITGDFARRYDYAHVFVTDRRRLEDMVAGLRAGLKPDGMIWISWPKKVSKVKTDISEEVLRTIFLPTGLVDVKVAAVDEIWSALKFMFRKELRAGL